MDVHGHQLVRPVADTLDAERPDVDVVLLPLDQLRHVRRVAGLVGVGHRRHGETRQDHRNRAQEDDTKPMNARHGIPPPCPPVSRPARHPPRHGAGVRSLRDWQRPCQTQRSRGPPVSEAPLQRDDAPAGPRSLRASMNRRFASRKPTWRSGPLTRKVQAQVTRAALRRPPVWLRAMTPGRGAGGGGGALFSAGRKCRARLEGRWRRPACRGGYDRGPGLRASHGRGGPGGRSPGR